jgi:DNA gyrase inhibitor GyrI
MTAGVLISNPTISYITLALLQETGWYKQIYTTYGQFINWGYQKGCSMLDPKNCSSN